MRYLRPLLSVAAALATTSLFLPGCSNKPAAKVPPPPSGAQEDTAALQRKMEEIKRANPNLPPTAVGSMAAEMVQREKAAGQGGVR